MQVRRWLPVLLVLAVGAVALAGAPEEALWDAARSGDLAAVKRLVEEQGVDVNAKTRYGATALHYACDRGHVEVVRYLLSKDAEANASDTFYNASPLTWALLGGHAEIAGMLIDKGANGAVPFLPRAVRDNDAELAAAILKDDALTASAVAEALAQAKQNPEATEIVKLLEAVELEPEPETETAEAVEVPAERLAGFSGSYKNDDIGMTIDIRVEEGALVGQATGQPPIGLRALSGNEFEAIDVPGIKITFGGRGGITETLVLEQGGQTLVFPRFDPELAAAEADAERAELPPLPAAERTAARNWPGFRGTHASGIGDGQGAPTAWNLESGENVRWKTEVPGLANSSPIVWGDKVFVTTAVSAANDETFRPGLYGDVDSVDDLSKHEFRVLAFDLRSGEPLWASTAASAVPGAKRHMKSTQANSTPVTDGERVVALFGTIGLLVAYDLDGKELWRTDVGVLDAGWFYDETYQWGHASSPILYDGTVIVQADVYENSFLAAYSLADGKLKWKTERDAVPSWGTPTVYRGEARDELITNGSTVRGYDPKTGKELWTLGPNSEVTVATPVVGDGVVYVTGGYPPARPVYAIKPGGSGDAVASEESGAERLAWSQDNGGTYMPTPILYDGKLFTCNNDGRMIVYDAASGERLYRARVGGGGGTFSASPVAADGRLYFSTEEGDVFVVRADTDEYVELAHNDVGEIVMSTPAVSDGVLVVRTIKHLIGLGAPAAED